MPMHLPRTHSTIAFFLRPIVVLITIGLCSTAGAQQSAMGSASSAGSREALEWQEPAAVEDRSISTMERKILQVLTPEQLEGYIDGEDPSSIVLPNGEDLATFLARNDRIQTAGLIYQPLAPCTILDSRKAAAKFLSDEVRAVEIRGQDANYTKQGGSNSGCGIPGLTGDLIKTNRARALFLNVEVQDAEGTGELRIGPIGDGESPEAAAVHFAVAPYLSRFKNAMIISLCDEESLNPCKSGDLQVQTSGAGAHLTITVFGFFESTAGVIARLGLPNRTRGTNDWANNGDDIFYEGGNVGIGTDSPSTALEVQGNITLPDSFSIGSRAGTSSPGSFALGINTGARGDRSLAIGRNTSTSNPDSIALGSNSRVSGIESTGIGRGTRATRTGSLALGTRAKALGIQGTAVGFESKVRAAKALAIGSEAMASHTNSVAIGPGATTTSDNQVVFGNASDAHDAVFFGTIESVSGGFKFPDGTVQTTAAGGPLSNCGFFEIQHAVAGPRDTFCPAGRIVAGVKANEDSDNNAILTHLYCCEL